jgi:ABC-type sugar transport system ATPase subunit
MRLEIRGLQRKLNLTILYVTHDQAEAMTLSDRIAVVQRGRFEQVGTPGEVYETPATPFVAEFLGRTVSLEGKVAKNGTSNWVDLVSNGARIDLKKDWRSSFNEGELVYVLTARKISKFSLTVSSKIINLQRKSSTRIILAIISNIIFKRPEALLCYQRARSNTILPAQRFASTLIPIG